KYVSVSCGSAAHCHEPASASSESLSGIMIFRRIAAMTTGAAAETVINAHSLTSRAGAGLSDQSTAANPTSAANNAAANTSALVRKISTSTIDARAIHRILGSLTPARHRQATIKTDSVTPNVRSYE